jgi:nucleotide-binding universal stress UspA family protein
MKQKISKIVVSMDGSEKSFKALKEAIYLARQCHSTITGLCVIPIYTINLGKLNIIEEPISKRGKKILGRGKKDMCPIK